MHSPYRGYDFPPFRPPNEASSALLRITRGCPWNRCEFCAMYKSVRFDVRPKEEIKQDILKACDIFGDAATIFLGDSDNLVHPDLPEIVGEIKARFPKAHRITCYARAKTIIKRKFEFLTAVRNAGLTRLHIGLESGDAEVLKRLNKGSDPEEMAAAGQKAKQAGFEISYYVLSGAGGCDRWKEHAVSSARVLNRAAPDYIRLRTLTVLEGTGLDRHKREGKFKLTPPKQRLEETRTFIRTLEVEDCFLASDHFTNYLWAEQQVIYRGIAGELPQEKGRMLVVIDRALDYINSHLSEIKDSNRLYQEGLIPSL